MRLKASCCGALFVAFAASQAQTFGRQPEPTIRTSTRIVAVTIVATRSDGSDVDDLRPSKLRVFDDGKPQTIVSFERMETGPATDTGAASASSYPTATLPKDYPHYSIILLDALNTAWSDQVYARRAVEHLLDYLPPGERIAIFALGGHLYLLHDFSSNSIELRAALHKFSSAPPHRGTLPSPNSPYSAEVSYSDLAAFSNVTHSREMASGLESRFYLRSRILQTFEALSGIASLAKNLPGQKDLLWVSSGFPLLVRGQNDTLDNDSYYDQEQQTARVLSSAGVRVYPIDARGLSSNPNASINIATMQRFAADTGGLAFCNNNDLSSLMRQALEDSRRGYLLTYTPQDFYEDGSFHKIRVRVSRRGVKLRYRPGYYAEALPSQPAAHR